MADNEFGEPAESTQSQPTRRRRRAASRPTGPPKHDDAPKDGATEKSPATQNEPSSKPTTTAAAAVDDSSTATDSGEKNHTTSAGSRSETPPRQRRRRATRPTAAPEPEAEQPPEKQAPARKRASAPPEQAAGGKDSSETPEDGADAIEKALRAAEREVNGRQADPKKTDSEAQRDRQAELDELAGAIASDEDGRSRKRSGKKGGDNNRGKAAQDESSSSKETSEASGKPSEAKKIDESSEDEESSSKSESQPDQETSGEDRPRRRRRRGGRRRRRGGARTEPDDDSSSSDEENEASGDDDDSDQDEDEQGTSSGTRRRRRRRRSGGGSHSDGGSGGSSSDEITSIEGSTRMEAKRQRRKESRAAGRRRAPILSESEFLARRESVDRKLVIRQREDYTQLAVVEDGILVEHYVDRASATSLIGNVYLGKIQNVLPSMEAAFIDIGRGRNAILYAGEVDWDHYGVSAENRKVEQVFKSGQTVLVQVTKDPIGSKGARLTGHISLPGRYIVYSPSGHLSGISRKLPDVERNRLRKILAEIISDDESVVVRTAAEGVSADELQRDVNRLKAQWEVTEKKVKRGGAPQALYTEPELTLRIVRDLFTEDFAKLIVEGDGGSEDAYEAVSAYVGHVAPHLSDRVEQFKPDEDGRDVFTEFRIDEQIAKALEPKVYLPSGGSLIIERTEAMTVIDVNTGRYTGAGGNLEKTVTSNNLEAAEEVVRQLRLRDIGGIIVIDFIDMVLPSNRELLLRRLVECLGRDRTRHQVAEVTSLGLVQMTRKRIGTGLAEAFTQECECCHGSGYTRSDEPVDSQAQADGGARRSGSNGRKRKNGGR